MKPSPISRLMAFAVISALLAFSPSLSVAQITFERIVAGLSSPIFVTHAPGDAERLFIVLQGGQIRIYNLTTDTLSPTPFMTVPEVSAGGERGLLGLAFSPDYQNNGLFYVNFTDNSGGDTRITQFLRINADAGDPGSAVKLLEFDQPQSNHNGGWIGFGPDEFLYIATGDGGGGGDTGTGHTAGTGNAQDITNNLLGKMLRIDVNSDDFPNEPDRNYAIPKDNPFFGTASDHEIYLYGIRNPWRCSFDRETGDLWIGDVGQNAVEEITFKPALAPGGQNYGWRNREGTSGSHPPGGSIDPIYRYFQGSAAGRGFCITGGNVYRGPIESLRGHYFFSDYILGQIRSFRFDGTIDEASFDGTNFNDFVNWIGQTSYTAGSINNPSSFGEDLEGNLYVCDLSGGEIFKLIAVETQTADSLTLVSGNLDSGGLPELLESDDQKLVVRANAIGDISIELESTSPTATPSLLSFTLETSFIMRSPQPVSQVVELYNYRTAAFEEIDNRSAMRFVDRVTTVEADGDLSRFVEPDSNLIKARLTLRRDAITRGIRGRFDHAYWTIAD